jgi:16S rRNA (cytosine967-C5)-methyltransferase
MREERLIIRVEYLISAYDYSRPFSMYLKEHFRNNPQMGSRDRRMTREWCYNYFRIGKAVKYLSFRERLIIGCFLCNKLSNEYLSHLLENSVFEETELILPLEEKLKIVKENYPSFNMTDLFPMLNHLSNEIPHDEWLKSFLIKPRVWIRIKQSKIDEVKEELNKSDIPFETSEDPRTLSFFPDVQLEKTKSYENGLFEIQDVSSQRTGKHFLPSAGDKWWDACAGSGGKSLMLMEQAADINLLATDVRPVTLSFYSNRMKKAEYFNFDTEVYDFDPPGKKKSLNLPQFDGIIADVPCTGSGTWSRSPEWNQSDISNKLNNHFVPLQRKIVLETLEFLKQGKPLVYITCSVFKEENEENIEYFVQTFPLYLEKFEYLMGYTSSADTLFVARFIRK